MNEFYKVSENCLWLKFEEYDINRLIFCDHLMNMHEYKLQAPYVPKGDQPKAIKGLVEGVNHGEKFQTLLGATGTGKSFTIANLIAQTGKPSLVLAHNKTLAAQLCNELREFFP